MLHTELKATISTSNASYEIKNRNNNLKCLAMTIRSMEIKINEKETIWLLPDISNVPEELLYYKNSCFNYFRGHLLLLLMALFDSPT